MPFVNVKTAEGLLDADQKRRLRERIVELLVEIEGRGNPDFRSLTTVLIEEHAADGWAVHGNPLEREDVEALAASL